MASRVLRQIRAVPPRSRKRACRVAAIGCFPLSALLFAASPLSALWSLSAAVRQNDVHALRDGMDWRALRIALKGDLADIVHPAAVVKLASAHAPAASDDDLPEFGSSFVTDVVSNAVDDEVTPERLLSLMRPDGAASAATPTSPFAALHRIAGLSFTAPDRFEVAFLPSDQPDAEPVRLSLRIEQWRWKVVAIHVPSASAVSTADARRT